MHVYESTFKFGGDVVETFAALEGFEASVGGPCAPIGGDVEVLVAVVLLAPVVVDAGVLTFGLPRKVGSSRAGAPAMPAGLGSSDTGLETSLVSCYGSSHSESDSYSPSVTYPPSIQLPPLPTLFKLFMLFYRVNLPPLALYTLLKPRCTRTVLYYNSNYAGCLSSDPLNTGITKPPEPAMPGGPGSILAGSMLAVTGLAGMVGGLWLVAYFTGLTVALFRGPPKVGNFRLS